MQNHLIRLFFLSIIFLLPGSELKSNSTYQVDSLVLEAFYERHLTVNDLIAQREYPEVLEKLKGLLEFLENNNLKDHLYYGTIKTQIGLSYFHLGNYERALIKYQKSRELILQTSGSSNLIYSVLLNNMGRLYRNKGNLDKALQLYIESAEIIEELHGKDHPEYGTRLGNLGVLYREKRDYSKAEEMLILAIENCKHNFSKEHPCYGTRMFNLALVYNNSGNFDAALQGYQTALDNAEKNFGTEHVVYGIRLNSIGTLYREVGQYEKAIKYLQKSVVNAKHSVGNFHRETIVRQLNLAETYNKIGDFKNALRKFHEIKYWIENMPKFQDQIIITTYDRMGKNLINLGQFKKGENYLRLSVSLAEEMVGIGHLSFRKASNQLARVLFQKEEYENAIQIFKNNEEFYRAEKERYPTEWLVSLSKISKIYAKMDSLDQAIQISQKSLEFCESRFGNQRSKCLSTMRVLGSHHKSNKDFDSALKYFELSLKICLEEYNATHPICNDIILQKAIIKENRGHYNKSEDLLITYLEQRKTHLTSTITWLSENERENFTRLFYKDSDILHTIIFNRQKNGVGFKNLEGIAYDHELFIKGFLLHVSDNIRRLVKDDSEAKLNSLRGYQRLLLEEYNNDEVDIEKINELKRKINEIERELSFVVKGYEDPSSFISWTNIQDRLSASDIALEFVNFNLLDGDEIIENRYSVIVLAPGFDQPRVIQLFGDHSLEKLFKNEDLTDIRDFINSIYGLTGENSLYEMIFKKLENYLEHKTTIYYTPAGRLNQINFNAISVDREIFLGEKYKFARLISTRNLTNSQLVHLPERVVLYGGIDYDYKHLKNDEIVEFDFSQPDYYSGLAEVRSVSGDYWSYLSGSLSEIKNIKSFLAVDIETQLIKGGEATVRSFQSYSGNSPDLLHIATHGFFFPNIEYSSMDNFSPEVFDFINMPFFRGGLVFSGANQKWSEGYNPIADDNGILTPYEIAQMDLSNTSLVVLSACETGLGVINGSEGVYGMQRAFKLAGVQNIIMSLWKVPDQQTAELMELFYSNWFSGMTISDAFSTAQRTMALSYPPYYWGGFVLISDGVEATKQQAFKIGYPFIAGLLVLFLLFTYYFYIRKKRIV